MGKTRMLGAVALALAITIIPATAAQAQPYPPVAPSLTVNLTTVTVGGRVTISGVGFGDNETIRLDSSIRPLAAGRPAGATQPGNSHAGNGIVPAEYRVVSLPRALMMRTTSDGEGNFSAQLELDDSGVVTLTATGESSGRIAATVVDVMPASSGGGLPVTGTNLIRIGGIGAGLLALGAAVILLTMVRRRRRYGPAQELAEAESRHSELIG
jgi:hypothetical protein